MFVPQQHPAREVQDTFYVKSKSPGLPAVGWTREKTGRIEANSQTHQKQVDPTKSTINEYPKSMNLEDTGPSDTELHSVVMIPNDCC